MKVGISVLLGVIGLVGAAYLWLYTGMAEQGNMAANSLNARLLIPGALRNIPLPEQCTPQTYARFFIECGGVCGTTYRVSFGTRATEDALQAHLKNIDITKSLGATSTEVALERQGRTCPNATFTFHIDEREVS